MAHNVIVAGIHLHVQTQRAIQYFEDGIGLGIRIDEINLVIRVIRIS